MAFIIGILLALLSLTVLAYPFLKARYLPGASGPSEDLYSLDRARSSMLDEMERLALDLDVGNITQQQYQESMEPLRQTAALTLRREEQLKALSNGSSPQLDQEIEEKIRLLRQPPQNPQPSQDKAPE